MSVFISGTGLFTPKESISNDELVQSFNSYVAIFNKENKDDIEAGIIDALTPSNSEFIKKASGNEQRFVMDKEGILVVSRRGTRVT